MSKIAKAVVGAIIAGLTAISTGLTDGALTGPEWIAAVVATLTGLAVIWGVPNQPAGDHAG